MTWTSFDGKTKNQIDHITISRKWKRSLHNVRVKRGAAAASDHHLVVAKLKIKLNTYNDQVARPSHKYNVHSLKVKSEAEKFKIELKNRFSVLSQLPEEPVKEHWNSLREIQTTTCKTVLGKKNRKHKEWLSTDIWALITRREHLKD